MAGSLVSVASIAKDTRTGGAINALILAMYGTRKDDLSRCTK